MTDGETVISLRDRVAVTHSGEYMCAELHHGGQVFTLTQHIGPDPMPQTVMTVSGILAANLAGDVWNKLWRGEIEPEPQTETVVDQFAGAGGWDVAARWLGMDPLGIEDDEHACATRDAAGFRTLAADIREVDPIRATGLISSPPCPTFSPAGRGSGRRNLDQLLELVWKLVGGGDWRTLAKDVIEDERTALVLEPLHWIAEMHRAGTPYRWVAMEQVPPVLPVWERYAEILREMGYSVATGNVHAEQYGVPQTRKRAVLLASLDHEVALPAPTHSKYYPRDPTRLDDGVEPWVSMAEALGWGMTQRPYPVIASSRTTGGPDKEKVGGSEARAQIYAERDAGRWRMLSAGRTSPETARTRLRGDDEPSGTITGKGTAAWVHERPSPTIVTTRRSDDGGIVGRQLPDGESRNVGGHNWPDRRPTTTVNGDPRISKPGHHDENTSGSQQKDAVRVSITEAAVLQSFPEDFPWRGTKTARFRQIGNAIPPVLAYHLLSSVTGISHDNHEPERETVAQTKWLTPKRSKDAKAHGETHGHAFGRLTVKEDQASAKCKNDGCAVTLHVTENHHELVPDGNGVISCGTGKPERVEHGDAAPEGWTQTEEHYVAARPSQDFTSMLNATADEVLMAADELKRDGEVEQNPDMIPVPVAGDATTVNDVLFGIGNDEGIFVTDQPDGSAGGDGAGADPTSQLGQWKIADPLPMTPTLDPDGNEWDPFAELIDLIGGFTKTDERSLQKLVGPSEIGTDCDRCLGKKLLQIPVTREVAWLPAIGRAVHAWLEHEFRQCGPECGWTSERKVPIGIVGNRLIKGTCDAFKHGVVVDFKIVGASTLKTVKARGASGVYRGQGHAYGRGYELEGYDVSHVMVLYLPRNSPTLADAEPHIEPYNRQIALDVLDRAQRIYDEVSADQSALLRLPRDPDCYDCQRFAPLPGEDAPGTGPRAGNPFAGIL